MLRQVLARARKDAQRGAGSGPGLDASRDAAIGGGRTDAAGDEEGGSSADVAGDEEVLAAARLLEDAEGAMAPGRAELPGLTLYVASSRNMGNSTFYRGVKLGLEHPA